MKQDDYQLLYSSIKNNSPTASRDLEKILPYFEGSIVKTFNMCSNHTGVCIDDIMNDKYLVLYNAIKTFDESRNTKLNSWVTTIAKFHAYNTNKSYKKHAVALSMIPNNLESIKDSIEFDESFLSLGDDLFEYIEELVEEYDNPHLRKIIQLKFKNSKSASLTKIGKEVGLTAERVRQIISSFFVFARGRLIKDNVK